MGRKCNRRGSVTLTGSKPGRRRALALLISLGLAIGCATPEDRYHALSIFFDDVPLPASMRPPPAAPEVQAVERVMSARPKAPALSWVVHEPECKECHTSRETQLAYADAPALCWDCHKQEKFADRFLHGPFAAGACLQCHTPHKSQHQNLLLAPATELCQACHDATTFAAMDRHGEEQGQDCVQCHSPHAAARLKMLKPDVPLSGATAADPGSGSGEQP